MENYMNKMFTFLTIFSFGYVVNDVLSENNINLIAQANADVAGMDYRDLRRDRDFRKAVEYIVEDCYILMNTSISC